MRDRIFFLSLAALVAFMSGCSGDVPTTEDPLVSRETEATPTLPVGATAIVAVPPSPTIPGPQRSPEDNVSAPTVGRTNQRADGNRLVMGHADLPAVDPIDIELSGVPNWVAGVAYGDGVLWAAVLLNGSVQGFAVSSGEVQSVDVPPANLPPGMPPLLVLEGGRPRLSLPAADFSQATHPILINGATALAFVDISGNVVIQKGDDVTTLPVTALPDARILSDEGGRLLLLSDPTDAYAHGVLGDALEARSVTLIDTMPTPRVAATIAMAEPAVIEGIAPIWSDLNGDGRREIIVTRTSESEGAQIVVFDEDGTMLAAGPSIGRGYRWRHQIAVAPFGPAGELELVGVLTPHIGGVVEFYRWRADALEIVAQLPGFTSHVIGSANLDMAVAGRFDASGRVSLLLPNQARTELAAIQRTPDGAEAAWSLPLDGTLITNLATAATADGRIALAAGRGDGVLRVWQR